MPRPFVTLTYSDAQHMVSAATSAADTFDVPYCVAVVDVGGNLLAFARQDEAPIGCIDLAINKARTACLFEKATVDLGSMAQPAADLYGIQNSNRGDVILIGGGLPVLLDGNVIGAVGASAGTVPQDVAVAEAALSALPA